MTRIERSIEINRPPEEVFDLITDLDRLPDWATIVVETRDVPHRPIQNGTTFRQTIRVAGRHLESEWHVAELERPRHVAYEATAPGGGQLAMKQTVNPTGDGSRVELELDYEPPLGFLGELMDRAYFERRNERDAEHSLHNLKDLLEGRPGSR
ncbi:MAG: SRPBCC family protein [Dehalococcoidia bacterium]